MPSVLVKDGYRFFFWSNENDEPAHIHVTKGGDEAKFWLNPIELVYSYGFAARETRVIHGMIEAHHALLEGAWNDYFGAN